MDMQYWPIDAIEQQEPLEGLVGYVPDKGTEGMGSCFLFLH